MLLIIKIGSNVLTRPDGLLDEDRIRAITGEVAAIKAAGRHVVLVSSGAVASGRAVVPAADAAADPVSRRQVLASVGQIRLIGTYARHFERNGLACAQVLVTKEDFRDREHYRNMENCLRNLLAGGIVPVVNENDVISVTELMFTDNDELAGLLAAMLDADLLVLLTNVDGIHSGPPGEPGSTRITDISVNDTRYLDGISAVKSSFGRGGMLTKTTMARKLARLGTAVHVADGTADGILGAVLSGADIGTRFHPRKRASRQKKWIAHADGAVKGELRLDAGAVSALGGAKPVSLLPVGVVAVTGDFRAGDVVRLTDPSGKVIGLGKTRLNADAAAAVKGLKHQKPIVHVDHLVLF